MAVVWRSVEAACLTGRSHMTVKRLGAFRMRSRFLTEIGKQTHHEGPLVKIHDRREYTQSRRHSFEKAIERMTEKMAREGEKTC